VPLELNSPGHFPGARSAHCLRVLRHKPRPGPPENRPPSPKTVRGLYSPPLPRPVCRQSRNSDLPELDNIRGDRPQAGPTPRRRHPALSATKKSPRFFVFLLLGASIVTYVVKAGPFQAAGSMPMSMNRPRMGPRRDAFSGFVLLPQHRRIGNPEIADAIGHELCPVTGRKSSDRLGEHVLAGPRCSRLRARV